MTSPFGEPTDPARGAPPWPGHPGYGPPQGYPQSYGHPQGYGQGYGQPQGYAQPVWGQQPYGPGPSGRRSGPFLPPGLGGGRWSVGVPVQVRRAFAIWMSMIGVWLALILVRTLVTSSGPSFADNPAFAAGRVVGTLVVLGVLAVVFAFLALHFRAGRNWARITLTVLTSVGLASALLALIGGIALLVVAPVGGILIHLFSLAILGAGATAIVLAWSAPSTAYVTGTWAGR